MEFVENHAVLAVGYDDKTELLKFQNSWGERWGQGGYGYLPYRYFETRLLDAWFEQPMTPEMAAGVCGSSVC
jgi:C1A family cysteine protease